MRVRGEEEGVRGEERRSTLPVMAQRRGGRWWPSSSLASYRARAEMRSEKSSSSVQEVEDTRRAGGEATGVTPGVTRVIPGINKGVNPG